MKIVMKTSMKFVVFMTIYSILPFAVAESDREYSDRRLNERIVLEWNNWGARVYAKADKNEEEIKKLQADIEVLRGLCSKKFNENIPPQRSDEDGGWSFGLILMATVGGLIIFVLGFVFWPRKVENVPQVMDSSSELKCPRCGWKRTPEDAVCSNPNCKIHF